ncbi:TadE/TadG family type IV pilus assembly protein [Vibrio astriarenae]|jgi:Flp pilus assembly protein TadG
MKALIARASQSNQKGLAAVEFLVSIPVILLILVGMTELGNALIRYNTLNKMAQSGIRYATSDIQGTATYDQVADHTAIKNMVVYGSTGGGSTSMVDGVTTGDVSVTHAGGYVTITISHNYTPVLGAFPQSGPFTIPLNASAVMRTAP